MRNDEHVVKCAYLHDTFRPIPLHTMGRLLTRHALQEFCIVHKSWRAYPKHSCCLPVPTIGNAPGEIAQSSKRVLLNQHRTTILLIIIIINAPTITISHCNCASASQWAIHRFCTHFLRLTQNLYAKYQHERRAHSIKYAQCARIPYLRYGYEMSFTNEDSQWIKCDRFIYKTPN